MEESGGVGSRVAEHGEGLVIVPVLDRADSLLKRIREMRHGGHVPLVIDGRWSRAQREQVAAVAAATTVPEGIAWATLTSGSSGFCKIVLRSESSWLDSFATITRYFGAQPSDAILLPSPASSSLTLFSIAHSFHGGPLPILAPPYGGRKTVDLDRVTCFHGTPETFRSLLERGIPPHLRVALIGGSPLDANLRKHAEEAGIRVIAYYGAAELSFVAVDEGDGLHPFPGVELRVRGGELWVRSPFVASGYATGATADASPQVAAVTDSAHPLGQGSLRREVDWVTVGDRAELVSGRLRLLGRVDNAILSASATIVPHEVEAALRTISGVRDAIVFGVPRGRVGFLVAALIEPTDLAPSPVYLRQAARHILAPMYRPRLWYVGMLPRTVSGKPARAEAVRSVLAGEVKPLVRAT
ncbi:class I adenylate-forming enzyme family protein [Lysinibacter sp. HNR]|uniref:AMP-binding protein n=1 Tax=Lysinibacter sp. HNR TaxID=3031408 RepID=UPI0024356753|nr:class I adenylate-forming enzyme family protein [Lysinibacter sp. HNR]WGD36881.1 class I adenylate-forming enzyme family protein [Lysinibacter sp. HNR]